MIGLEVEAIDLIIQIDSLDLASGSIEHSGYHSVSAQVNIVLTYFARGVSTRLSCLVL